MKFQTTQFKSLIRQILHEEVEKRSVTDRNIYNRLPEVNHGEDLKKFTPHPTETKTKEELLEEITAIVKGINKSYKCIWDDHDDIFIHAEDLFKIRILPRWENNYNIEAYNRNEDRIYVTGQTWEQVKEFVKVNLKPTETNTELNYARSLNNYKDRDIQKPDEGLPQKNKPKTLPLTNEKVNTEKNKDKNYSEEAVKEKKDLPNAPMKEVENFVKQLDHKVKDPVKLKKQKPNTKLVVKQ
jgi:hypothetical protein